MSIFPGLPFQRQMKKKKEPVRKCEDGREVLDLKTAKGRKLYKERLTAAWVAQRGKCALCGLPVALEAATADHIVPKGHGGSTHDDRASNIQAACWACNVEKGSKRIA